MDSDVRYYAIKHKDSKKWVAYKLSYSQVETLNPDYDIRGPFLSLFRAMISRKDKESGR